MNDKARWDAKYAEGEYAGRAHPSAYLVEHAALLESIKGRKAADLACGRGRNSWYLASLGFTVQAYDVSPVGLSLASQADYGYGDVAGEVVWEERDLLVDGLPQDARFDLIIMVRFVSLPLLENIAQHLNAGGVVIAEKHLRYTGPEQIVGPRSARFRVAPGALGQSLSGFTVLDQYEGLVVDPDGEQAAVARIIAQNPDNSAQS